METTIVLSVLALIIILSTLYCLKDTISEALFDGKSTLPNELKSFNSGVKPKKKISNKEAIKRNKNRILAIDIASILVVVFIAYMIATKAIIRIH